MDQRRNSLELVPELAADHVKIADEDALLQKIEALHLGGREKLQVITDYDLTISKHHVNGVRSLTSFALINLCKGIPDNHIELANALRDKYLPIEFDPKLSKEEKTPHMQKWYAECQDLYNGLDLQESHLMDAVKVAQPQLRDGAVELLRSLAEDRIPVLVLSAGLGDVIQTVFKHYGVDVSDVFHIVSNFFKQTPGSNISGFGNRENGHFIHPYNKSGLGCIEYFENKSVQGRSNVILMGDSIGDANMHDGVPHVEQVLKIGFLYGTTDHVDQCLPKFLSHFDIVLIDDQTMAVPQAILNFIIRKDT